MTGFARREGGDVTDAAAVRAAVAASRPEVVFHLAALATVQQGYDDPAAVYATNVVGTANVLQAVRESDSVRAVVAVTSDKCYLDQGAEWAYREDDRLGGYDPYSSSKAAQELVIAAFRDSIGIPVASVRAGNVIGGGDETHGRLVPDLIRAGLTGEPMEIRAPHARRPWQHVLNPLEGYLLLAERLAGRPHLRDPVQLRPRRGAAHGRVDRRARARAVAGRARPPLRRAPAPARGGDPQRRLHARPHAAGLAPAVGPRRRDRAHGRVGARPPRRAATCRSSRSSATGR